MVDGGHLDTSAGAAVYSPVALKYYDFLVLRFSNRFVWNCLTDKHLLPFFKKHLGQRHLDVGVGTGYYLANANLNAGHEISLLDLNPNSLQVAAERIGRPCHCVVGDVMKPDPLPAGSVFDSISIFYLYHCLPGTMEEKAHALANLATYLAPNGVLYGVTILGDDVGHNILGRRLMAIYNAKGVFGNRRDTLEGIEVSLQQYFHEVSVTQKGKVAFFVVRSLKI